MNDAAVSVLAPAAGSPATALTPGLRAMVAAGIEARGDAVIWAGAATPPPGARADLTRWECSANSFHLEDQVPVDVVLLDDGEPSIADGDQVTLLRQGVALALEVCRLVYDLAAPTPVRCIVGVGSTNGTFRFHRIRAGQDWLRPDLDAYRQEKLVVVDVEPAKHDQAS